MTPSNTAHIRAAFNAARQDYDTVCGATETKGEEFWLLVDRAHAEANARAGSRLVLCGECAVVT